MPIDNAAPMAAPVARSRSERARRRRNVVRACSFGHQPTDRHEAADLEVAQTDQPTDRRLECRAEPALAGRRRR
jgi:hypothetical protein